MTNENLRESIVDISDDHRKEIDRLMALRRANIHRPAQQAYLKSLESEKPEEKAKRN
jgi:hypothetical protein